MFLNNVVLATGSNVGDRFQNLTICQKYIEEEFELLFASKVYESEPVDYLEQDQFLNQCLLIKKNDEPEELFKKLQEIEKKMGRHKKIPKGPRNIDIDIIFYNNQAYQSETITIPHPSWQNRSFVILPLLEIPGFKSSPYFDKISADVDLKSAWVYQK